MRAAAALLAGLILLGPATGAAQQVLSPWSGGPTPALKLKDLEGREHALAAYRGKVVLVNFWATWCEPCKEEMPSIERLRRSLEGRPFAVLAVNLAEPDGRVQAFLRQVPLGFPVLMDRDAAAAKAWKARMLPATFIVGADGRVRYSYIGELDWSREPVRRQIAELLPR
jgi:cytochrome c biogenesis protein CcmG, thiol:disulfide interchange protein DsbE